MNKQVILTCEHAGNEVPASYRHLFEKNSSVLNTHRGYDIGALELIQLFGRKLNVTPHIHEVTRLLVDLNRSLKNPSAFSEFVHSLDREQKKRIVEEYYDPHRQKIEEEVSQLIDSGTMVLHLSVHTFTPELNGITRDADVGLLYDPQRIPEKTFCKYWKSYIQEADSDLKTRMNYPYQGTMDGFVTHLRDRFRPERYIGVEIEVNQRFPLGIDAERWKEVQRLLVDTFVKAIKRLN